MFDVAIALTVRNLQNLLGRFSLARVAIFITFELGEVSLRSEIEVEFAIEAYAQGQPFRKRWSL